MTEMRRLDEHDVEAVQVLRRVGLRSAPDSFRFDLEQEFTRTYEATRERLARAWVVGVHAGPELVAMGGVQPFVGTKLQHKWLL